MTQSSTLQLVDADGIDIYPISSADRLDGHYFLPWHLKRWRGSDTRKKAYKDPEVGFYAMELFFKCQDETPIGTLPTDQSDLAFMLHMSTDKFQSLLKRDLSPLRNWYLTQCDNGEIRWAHPVVRDFVLNALSGSRANAAKNADDRMRKRLGTIVGHLKAQQNMAHLARSDDLVNDISDWIARHYPGGSATLRRVKEAVNDLSSRG